MTVLVVPAGAVNKSFTAIGINIVSVGSFVGSVSMSGPSTDSAFNMVVPVGPVPVSDTSVALPPVGVVPLTFAVFNTFPMFKSDCVIV